MDRDLLNAADGWPKSFSCRFIEPGLVRYSEYGTVLVPEDALASMAKSFVGKPVVNEAHRDVEPDVYSSGSADGIVTSVRRGEDGWWWADFLVWDPKTMRNCSSAAYSVSCAYTVSDIAPGGSHNNVPYDQEVRAGEYTHLAIVANPRYEGARIVVLNSKEGTGMGLFSMFTNKKEPVKADNAVVLIDGKEVPVKDLVEAHNAAEAAKAPAKQVVAIDTIIEIDGKEVSLGDLAKSYQATMKNADDKAEKDKKDKEDEERKNAEEEEKKKKDDEERKNAEEKAKKDEDEEKKKKEMENSKGSQHFEDLRKAANMRGEPQQPTLSSRKDMAKTGAKRYGSDK